MKITAAARPSNVKRYNEIRAGEVFYAQVKRTGVRTDGAAYYLKLHDGRAAAMHTGDVIGAFDSDNDETYKFTVVDAEVIINE